MFNFSDISNSNENNYTENVIYKQSKEFLKKQKNNFNRGLKEGFTEEQSKGISSFNDPNKLYDSTYSKSLQQNVTNTIDKSKQQTETTKSILKNSFADLLIDDENCMRDDFMDKYNDYSQINNNILNNTQNFINTDQTQDINVYVNSLPNSTSQFVNLYNGTSNVTSYGDTDIDSCMKFAQLKGYSQFSLSNSDGTNSVCNVPNDNSNLTSSGIYIPNCKQGTDGNVYGGGWGNAIYENVGTTPTYIGCYRDNPARAMLSAGLGEMGLPVYVAGNYGCSPWGAWANNSFPIKEAQWIWYTENSASNAPINSGNPVTIRGTINVTSTSIVYAEIYVLCDDHGTIAVNGVNTNENLLQSSITDSRQLTCTSQVMKSNAYLGSGKTGYIVPLNPGTNYIDVDVVNTGGPAGLCLALIVESSQPYAENNLLNITASSNGTQYYCTNDTNWTYATDSSNLVTPYSQSFSIESCGKYAYENGYQYFGLQNIMNNNLNSLQCFVSNDLSQATQYGSWDGSVTNNGTVMGLGPVSAVYNINSPGNYNNIGKAGYINEQNQLLQYPSSMIQYGTSNTYTTIQDVDSTGNDITRLNLNKEECEQQCNQTAGCYGYVNRSNNCWLKNSNVFSYSNLNGPLSPFPGNELNIKDIQIINDKSCPKEIKNINTVDWENYNMSSEIMNANTKCGLVKMNEELVKEREQSEIGLNWITNQLSQGLSSLMTNNKVMSQQMDLEHNIIQDNISFYDVVYDKYKKIMKGDYNNVNNILANSQITVLQSRYFYVLWAILAIAIIISLVMLIRKYTE